MSRHFMSPDDSLRSLWLMFVSCNPASTTVQCARIVPKPPRSSSRITLPDVAPLPFVFRAPGKIWPNVIC